MTVPVQMILGADCSLSLGVGNPHRSLKTLGLTYVVFYSLIGCCLFDTFPISTYLPIPWCNDKYFGCVMVVAFQIEDSIMATNLTHDFLGVK